MLTRLNLVQGPVAAAEPDIFRNVFVRRQRTWPSLLVSAIGHGLAFALIPTLAEALSGFGYVPAARATYTVEPLRLDFPEGIYSPPPRSRPKAQSKAEKPAPARRSQQVQAAAGAGPRPRAAAPKRLELPIAPSISDQAPVILQPDVAKLLTPSLPAVPPMAFWTKSSPPPVRRQVVIPGRAQAPPVSPNLDAPPVLSPSNSQPAASDVTVALAAVQTPAAPKLPLPNSSTNPVRIRGEGGTEIASFEAPQSDPLNLISLTADNSAAKRVEIPRGLQNAPRSDADGGTAMTPARAPDDREKSPATPSASRDRTAPATAATARTPDTASAAGTATAPRTPSAAGASRAAANNASAAAGQQSAVAAANSPQGSPPAAVNPAGHPLASAGAHSPDPIQESGSGVIRMTHPSNGNFDVVILQSLTRDDLPDVGGALSGNPVYTVYLSVGDAREWLLEYCLPASANSRASSFQVNIDDPGPISAPYPLSTAIPRSVFELPHPKHIVLHGLLSAAGVLREVKTPNMENPLVREVLPLLSQWQFRPALRDKVPVEVEILLIIPPRT